MFNDLTKDIMAVLMAVIGLAMLAVIIKSQYTSTIIGTSGSAFSSILNAASSGGNNQYGSGYTSGGMFGGAGIP